MGPKLDYCNRDLEHRRPELPGSPSVFRFPACAQDPNLTTVTLGTSVGWVDSYPWSYPSNWIEVTVQGRPAAVPSRVPALPSV